MKNRFLFLAGRLSVSVLMLIPLAGAAQAQIVLVSNVGQRDGRAILAVPGGKDIACRFVYEIAICEITMKL